MKKTASFSSIIVSAVLAFLIAVSSVSLLSTAFSLYVPLSFVGILLVFLLILGAACCGKWTYGIWPLIGSLAVLCTAALYYTDVVEQAIAIIECVSAEYSEVYGWSYIDVDTVDSTILSAEQPLLLIATLFGSITAYGTVRGWNPFIAAGLSALPLIPCLVMTHTPPHPVAVFVWLTSLLTLLLTVSGYKKRGAPKLSRTAATAGVLLAVMGLLFTCIPADEVYNQKREWRDRVLQTLGLSPEEENPHVRYQISPTVELSEAGGPRGTTMIMKILASRDKTVYVREQDYNIYTGAQWNTEIQRADSFQYGRDADWYLTIQTPEVYAKRFFPYYPAHRVMLEGGHQVNNRRETEYTWKVADLPEDWKEQVNDLTTLEQPTSEIVSDVEYWDHGFTYYPDGFVMMPPSIGGSTLVLPRLEADPSEYAEYLALPAETKAWASTYVGELLTDEVTYTQKADTIAAYVQQSAKYSTRASTAVKEGEDFARLFLEEEKEGCCVHFATATAVLLRAAGVPTRYVTGYAHWANRATWTAITEENAHAWVEYYEPRLNKWILLDATPVSFEPQIELTTTTDDAAVTTMTTPVDEQTTPTRTPSDEQENDFTLPWKELGICFGTAACLVLVIVIQRAIRLSVRRRRQTRGTSNERALALWHEAERLARALKTRPCEEAKALSKKAKFSQYSLTDEELAVLANEVQRLTAALSHKPWIVSVWNRTVRALY